MNFNIHVLWRGWYSVTRLMRWEDYTTFLQLVLGFALVRSFRLTPQDAWLLFESLMILAPLLYGGLYTLNDVMDAKRDKLNSIKKQRPIPKGYVSRNKAFIFALLLIAGAGIGASLLSNVKLQIAVISFLFVNLFYTFVAKHIPYLELVVNALTHPMRVFFGAWLAGGTLPVYLYFIWFLGVSSGTVFRRIKEMTERNESSRPVLSQYSRFGLVYVFFIGIITCGILGLFTDGITRFAAFGWSIVLTFMYFAYFSSKNMRKLIEFAWR